MNLFKNKYKREGLIGAILIHLVLLLIFAFFGLSYQIPPPVYGMQINFGLSDQGSGEIQPEEQGEQEIVEEVQEEQPVEETIESQPTPTDPVEEQVLTQDDTEAPEVKAAKNPKPKQEKVIKNDPKKEETADTEPPKETKPVEKPKPDVKSKFKNVFGKKKSGGGSEGDDKNKTGDKGKQHGTMDPGAYDGVGGEGSGGNYSLGGRKALTTPEPLYECQEEGTVVVYVTVDRSGKTLRASVGKGTDNYAECLTKRALQAAHKTKWQASSDAPIEQRGKITYRFRLQ